MPCLLFRFSLLVLPILALQVYWLLLTSMATPILQVKNLSIDFMQSGVAQAAVKNISFDLAAGQTLAIVGESGSGKSVTALALLQLLSPQAVAKGEILFTAIAKVPIDLLQLKAKQIQVIRGKAIAMIFQEPMTSLNPVFTCGSQVLEAIQSHEKQPYLSAKQKTIALFEQVNLPHPAEIFERYPHQLSGGQKQRVMIAMAMSCNPAILIADEATTALDVTVQKTIVQLLKKLQAQTGMGLLFITHDLGLVADIADRVMVMRHGEIVEQGDAATLLQKPQAPYTKALLACRPALYQRGERLQVVSDFMKDKSALAPPKVAPAFNGIVVPDEGEPVLVVKDLNVFYAGKRKFLGKIPAPFKAVDGVSFSIRKGETVGLVGESGCGKTTLGRAILQLIAPTSGKIILNGTNLCALTKKQLLPFRKNMQIVFQDPYGSLNPRMTIGEAILEPMQVHGILNSHQQRKERVEALLEKVGLSGDQYHRYPHQFSGGQRQRICIARSLALNPSFLIFDESVSALDVSVQAQVLNMLHDLKNEFGFTALFISHDLSVVRYCSDRILVMQQGKIVEEGLADEVYYAPQHAYTQKLLASIPGNTMQR